MFRIEATTADGRFRDASNSASVSFSDISVPPITFFRGTG
jgi:hypothetical protein